MAGRGLIFDVGRRAGDAAGLFFRRCVDLVIGLVFTEVLGDRSRQRRLAMVDVADRTDVDVRLIALKLTLCHLNASYDRERCEAGVPVWSRRLRLSRGLRKT
ncbi:hypothetical protein D3C87_1939620 [compost metagenome]